MIYPIHATDVINAYTYVTAAWLLSDSIFWTCFRKSLVSKRSRSMWDILNVFSLLNWSNCFLRYKSARLFLMFSLFKETPEGPGSVSIVSMSVRKGTTPHMLSLR